MITSAAQIIARISDPKQAQKLRGKGVVEEKLDDTTYLIRFSSGKIKVTVTAGALVPDTVVYVKNQDGKIIVQPLTTSENQGDRIVLTGAKHETALNKAVHELLSFLADIPSSKETGHTEPDYSALVKKLASAIADNQQLINSDKDLQPYAKKIIQYSTQPLKTPDEQTVQEIKSLLQSFRQKLIDLCFTLDNTVNLPKPVEQGFIYFTDNNEASNWLVKTQPNLDRNVLDNIAVLKSEPVIIRTVNDEYGATAALVMNEKEAVQILDTYIHNAAKSHLWETVQTDLLLSILQSRGSITTETIEAIDKILQLYSKNPNTTQIQTEEIAKPVVHQWVALMLDNAQALQTISSFVPAHTADDIAHMVEHTITKSLPEAAMTTEIIKGVLTNSVNNPDVSKTGIIANAFEKMGFSLEQELAKAAFSDSVEEINISDNVKASLLSLLFQTIPQEESTPLPIEAEDNLMYVYTIQQLHALDSMIQKLVEIVNTDLEKAITELSVQGIPQSEKAVHETIQMLKNAVADLIQQLSVDNQKLLELISAENQSKTTTETQSTSQHSELLKNLTETAKSVITDNLIAQQPVKAEAGHIDRIEIEKLLHALLQFVEKQMQKIQKYGELLKDFASTEMKQLVHSLIEKTSDILNRITEQLETLLSSVKSRHTISTGTLEDHNAIIKQVTADSINTLFKPLDNILNSLASMMRPVQTGRESGSQIQAFADSVYKTIIDYKSSLADEIAQFTQNVISNIVSRKGSGISTINAGVKSLIENVNSFSARLSSMLYAEKSTIERAVQERMQQVKNTSILWSKESTAAMSAIEERLTNSVSELTERLYQSIIQQSTAQKSIKEQLNTSLQKMLQSSVLETVDTVKQLVPKVSNNVNTLRFSARESLQQQFHSTFRAVESSLKNMIINLRNYLYDAEAKCSNTFLESPKDENSMATVLKNIQSIANRLSHDISRILDSALKEIMTLLEKAANEVEKNPQHLLRQVNDAATQAKQEAEQLIKTISRQVLNLSSRAERAFDSTLPDGIRQQVETALSRLETLQLLAKPTPTSEGQQQILSLPMKIGDEWTDVNILLIKKRERKKGRISSDKFAVRMYVSPSLCGPVIVNMDYHAKHKLTVRIEFENNDTRFWFNKHIEQLIHSLKEFGMGSIAVSLESAVPKDRTRTGTQPKLPVKKGTRQSKIDISI